MNNWAYTKVEDICRVIPGGTPSTDIPEYWGGDIAWITPKDLSMHTSRYISNGERWISKLGLKNSSASLSPVGSVIISTRAPIGYLAIAANNISTNQGMKALIPKRSTSTDYLYYLMKFYTPNIIQISTGTTFKEISTKALQNMLVRIPSFETQKQIARILSSLDDKIEINNKINKTLEEIAQTLYKRWFVDFEFPNENGDPYKSSGGEMVESELGLIPANWENNVLGSYLDLVKTPTRPGAHLRSRIYTPIDVLEKKHLVLNESRPIEEAQSSLLLYEKYDILMAAMRVYFHKVNLSFDSGVTRTTAFVLRSRNHYALPFNLLTINQDATISFANGTSKGSTMPYAVWEGALDRFPIIAPSQDIIIRFYEAVMPFLEKIYSNNKQTGILRKIRDELLPKLMSGEIEVPIEG